MCSVLIHTETGDRVYESSFGNPHWVSRPVDRSIRETDIKRRVEFLKDHDREQEGEALMSRFMANRIR